MITDDAALVLTTHQAHALAPELATLDLGVGEWARWTSFNDDRGTKSKPIPGPHQVYGFLTTAPNAIVAPIHPKAMP